MNFISIKFIIFFIIVLSLVKIVKQKEKQHIILLISSYIFYAAGDIRFLILLIALSIIIWYLGIQINTFKENNKNAKIPLSIGIIICLISLGFFKYFNFFVESFAELFNQEYSNTLNIILPLGISFYTFQAISYLCDVYFGKMKVQKQIQNVLLYIGFFPQIVSGPIVKAHDFFPQLEYDCKITKERLSYGFQLILIGLFKKIVIADRLCIAVNAVYSAPEAYSGMSLLFAAIAYSIQIYCDFSGYSDMAIGIAHILGFDLGLNFNMPYISTNPSDFWRRWHISLSSWFRDYVYIPLGGSRKGHFRTYFNLFITMLLSGLWHGASWTFIVWGALYGIASVIHKKYTEIRKKNKGVQAFADNKLIKVASIILNVSMVWLLWIPFRADNFKTAWSVITRIFTMSEGISYIFEFTIIYTIIIMGYQILSLVKNNGDNMWKPLNLSKFSSQVIIFTFIILIFIFAYIGNTAFIYAQF